MAALHAQLRGLRGAMGGAPQRPLPGEAAAGDAWATALKDVALVPAAAEAEREECSVRTPSRTAKGKQTRATYQGSATDALAKEYANFRE
eukprot:13826017-Alexandrium_andersonii.AAC.1